MKREEVRFIVVHCSRSLPDPTEGFRYLDRRCRLRGALSCGYHFIVRQDGVVEEGRPADEPGCHCRGYNDRSLGVCVMGGVGADGRAADTRTPEQARALVALLRRLLADYPGARVAGHEALRPKEGRGCPGFPIPDLSELGANP